MYLRMTTLVDPCADVVLADLLFRVNWRPFFLTARNEKLAVSTSSYVGEKYYAKRINFLERESNPGRQKENGSL